MEKVNILIVEDEAVSALLLVKYMEALGHDCGEPVASGKEAILRAESDNPDIIFMDIRLADEVDGIEAAKVILGKRFVPIVFMTAYSDDNIMKRAKSLNHSGYFTKPLRLEAVKTLVNSILESRKI